MPRATSTRRMWPADRRPHRDWHGERPWRDRARLFDGVHESRHHTTAWIPRRRRDGGARWLLRRWRGIRRMRWDIAGRKGARSMKLVVSHCRRQTHTKVRSVHISPNCRPAAEQDPRPATRESPSRRGHPRESPSSAKV